MLGWGLPCSWSSFALVRIRGILALRCLLGVGRDGNRERHTFLFRRESHLLSGASIGILLSQSRQFCVFAHLLGDVSDIPGSHDEFCFFAYLDEREEHKDERNKGACTAQRIDISASPTPLPLPPHQRSTEQHDVNASGGCDIIVTTSCNRECGTSSRDLKMLITAFESPLYQSNKIYNDSTFV